MALTENGKERPEGPSIRLITFKRLSPKGKLNLASELNERGPQTKSQAQDNNSGPGRDGEIVVLGYNPRYF